MIRPGQAKGPSLNPAGTGGGTILVPTIVPAWAKLQITYAQLAAAALTNNIELFSLIAGGVIHAIHLKTSTLFTGTGITGYRVSVGVAADLERYASLFDVRQAVGATVKQISNVLDSPDNGAATSVKIAAVSTGANLNSGSGTGVLEVGVLISLCTLP